MTTTPAQPAPSDAARSHPAWWSLARHYLEMVLAMFAGMLVLGAVRELVGLTVAFSEHPATSFLLMATDMGLGMAAWMLLRHHTWTATLEMCAAMYVPVVLLPLLRAGAMGPMSFMVWAHVLMMVAMLAVLLRRRAELASC